jgi:hypothetical protein
MKTLFYQCSSGISGDMNLGALVDVGVPEEYLRSELARLQLDKEFVLSFSRAEKMGIWGTRAKVLVQLPRNHGHLHGFGQHRHSHHEHRRYADIKRLIDRAGYSERVTKIAIDIFQCIAEAEAVIHATDIEDVHFHEVGATDSIVDIVGAAICLDYLKVERIVCSPIELGGGFVQCEHGRLPVPAPATMEILKGMQCRIGGVDGEATTPTGAAILKATAHAFDPGEEFVASRIGYGIGMRDFNIPNALRVMLGESTERRLALEPTSFEIKANIDDMTPEAYEPLMERLFSSGASDVFLTPIVMKKNRLAHMVSVLCNEKSMDLLVQTLFEHSTTIGVRVQPAFKRMLPRSLQSVATSYGDVRVKIVELPGGGRRWKVEHDDVKKLAADCGVAYLAIRKEIEAEVRQHLDGSAPAIMERKTT